jgi:hypothetical protein
VCGAIVLAGAPAGQPLGGADAFGRAFLVAAASLAVALIALALMEEKPLQTGAEMDGQ